MNIFSIANHQTFTWLRNIRPSRKALCVSLLVLPVFIVIANHYFREFTLVQYDDSYITYRYARNFALGDGLRFNPGDDTNSASSLLFVLLLGIGNLVTRAPIELIATTINTLSLLVLVFVTSLLILRSTNNLRGYLYSFVLGLSIVSYGPLVYWTLSGMETTFFMALLATSILLCFHHLGNHRLYQVTWLLVILGLLAITRVEGAVCGAALGAVVALRSIKHWKSIGLFKLVLPVLVPTGMFASQLLFYKIYYGAAIADPIHFKDKVRYYSRSTDMAWAAVKQMVLVSMRPFLLMSILGLLLLIAHIIRKKELKVDYAILPVLLVLLSAFILRSPHSDEYRYELVLFVFFVLATALVIEQLNRLHSFLQQLLGIGVVLVFGLTAISQGASESKQISSRTSTYMYVQKARADAGKWLENNSPAGSRVVASDIGALSYFNPSNVFLDAPGLVNRSQLKTVLNSEDVYLSMKNQGPEYLADTVGPDGVSGVEIILSNPLGYYVDNSAIWSSCNQLPIFSKQILKVEPLQPSSVLQIQVARITWDQCK
jgi:hypothetical protein